MKIIVSEKFTEKSLLLAGIFNLVWGLTIVLFPHFFFDLFELTRPNYPEIWQCLGMVIALFGFGYLVALTDPMTHWLIVLVGFLGKFIGILGFLKSYLSGSLPLKFGWLILLEDVVWLVPFYCILVQIYHIHTSDHGDSKKFNDLISQVKTNRGQTLSSLSSDHKVLLVFIRHLGCTFCRETVSSIAKFDDSLKGKNLVPVFVHMSDPEYADKFFSTYYQTPVHHISDPQRKLFRSLGIQRGTLLQLFGPKVLFKGIWAGLFKGHGIGAVEGDPLQLGGVFVLSKGQIIFEHRNTSASDSFELNILPEF